MFAYFAENNKQTLSFLSNVFQLGVLVRQRRTLIGQLYMTVRASVSLLLILHTWFDVFGERSDCTGQSPTICGPCIYVFVYT